MNEVKLIINAVSAIMNNLMFALHVRPLKISLLCVARGLVRKKIRYVVQSNL